MPHPSDASRPRPGSGAPLRKLTAFVALFGILAGPAATCGAAPSPPKEDRPPAREAPTSTTLPATEDDAVKKARADAEALYAKGYAQVEEAKKQRDSGKESDAKDAKKKFKKALGNFESAIDRAPEYYEAWNMVGYCSRNLGDLKKAFAAYDKALSINPNYDEAHEYLGEAYIQSGDLAKAKTELAWLRARDSDEAEELAEKIEKAEGKAGKSEAPKSDALKTEDAKTGSTEPAPTQEPANAQESGQAK